VDGWSREKVAKSIEAIRYERWPWTPVNRILLDQPKGGKRPLGLPVWAEKVVQDIVRSILEAYYEPQCSTDSPGCRPKRGCHTALHEVGATWTGTKWFIEGDSKGCFDPIDHAILMTILRETIQDNRFLQLIAGALKAGYCAAWTSHPSLSGSPQGGIVSPMLSNSSMDRLDRFVQDTLIPEYTRGIRRKSSREYKRLEGNAHSSRKTGRRERAEELRQVMQQQPSVAPNDEEYSRLRDVRYADGTPVQA
jgi:retron-type reverse transcriptase